MNTRWARIQDNVVFEFVDEDPEGLYHESLVFVKVEDPEVSVGWRLEDGVFSPPLEPQPPAVEPEVPSDPPAEREPVYRTAVSKVEYYGLFKPLEEALIRLAAAREVTPAMVDAATPEDREKLLSVLVLRVMLSRVDNLSSTQVIQLGDPQVAEGLVLCVQMDLLEDHRPDEITRGVREA